MGKKVFMHIWVLIVVVGILFIANSNTAKAASKLEIKVNSSVSAKLTEFKTLNVTVYYNGRDVTNSTNIDFKSSNKSIAYIEDYDGNNNDDEYSTYTVYPKKTGKCVVTITAQYRPEPSYWDAEKSETVEEPVLRATAKCTVNVQPHKSLRAHACLVDYNTRSNTFIIKVKNISNKNITILSKGAKARDCDYKKFDRKLRIKGKSKVVIKPGQTKTIRFKVIGKTTWYDFEDFEVRSYWKWGKKKYLVSVDSDEGVYIKRGKKWKDAGSVDERWFGYDE